MPALRQLFLTLLAAVVVFTSASHTLAQDQQDLAALWIDFNHYVRIARPALAQSAAKALMDTVDDQQLLALVEASEYTDYEHTLDRALNIEMLKDTANQINTRLQAARIELSRDPKRIMADIQKLAQGERANANATLRLKTSGQFAAPYLLKALLDDNNPDLHPWVQTALVAIGRPLVEPLAIALPHLEPVPMGQIARALGEIGYPQALPYLKQVIDNPPTDPTARTIAQAAFDQLVGEPGKFLQDASPAQLFVTLIQNYHYTDPDIPNDKLSGFDLATGLGIVWKYNRDAGLVPVPVPGEVYSDVLIMHAARAALLLDPEMDTALSLWIMANLRRENRLPSNAQDNSYSPHMHPPSFYALMSGPQRLHDVLARALESHDAELTLDAVQALDATAGTDALFSSPQSSESVTRCLTYPDRRVRLAMAFAVANAHPDDQFPGSDHVVRVLAQAIRQPDTKSAVVIAPTTQAVNALMATMTDLGYHVIGGLSLVDAIDQLSHQPGVDLLVVDDRIDQIELLYHQTDANYRLAGVPILAMVSSADQIQLNRHLENRPRLHLALKSDDPQAIRAAVEQAAQAYTGPDITPQQTRSVAIAALKLLHQIALHRSHLFFVPDAQPSLILAIKDYRQDVAQHAAAVLALIDDPQAQLAIANAALDQSRPSTYRQTMFRYLAKSATRQGNHLPQALIDNILEQVMTTGHQLSTAAATAHGALTLPTKNVVKLITSSD